MNRERILEYADLCAQCYNIPGGTHKLPKNWQIVSAPRAEGNWDTFYAIFVNTELREVVMGIRGTEPTSIFNMLTDVGLLASALSGNYQRPPHQGDLERAAEEYRETLLSEEAIEDLDELRQDLRSFDTVVGDPLEGLHLTEMYLALLLFGLATGAVLAVANPITLIPTLVAIHSLRDKLLHLTELNDIAQAKFQEKLGSDESRQVITKLDADLNHFTKKHFPGYIFKIVGHSLGGVHAQLCAVKLGVQCISFESPGTAEMLKLSLYNGKPHRILNFLSAPNMVNTLSAQAGKVYRMHLPLAVSGKLAHGANCFIAALSLGIIRPTWWTEKYFFLQQHGINNIVEELGRSRFIGRYGISEMGSWPINPLRRGAMVNEYITGFMPFRDDAHGLRTMFNEEGMRAAAIRNMAGYVETCGSVDHFTC